MQVRIGFDGGGVIAVFPKRAQARFPAVVALRRSSRSKLHAAGDDAFLRVLDQQMNVIGRHHIVEDAQPEALACFVEPAQVAVSVASELEEKVPLVASMGEVPDMARQEVTIGTRHCVDLLKRSFCHPKGGSKYPAGRYFKDLSVRINALRWSDPDLLSFNESRVPGGMKGRRGTDRASTC